MTGKRAEGMARGESKRAMAAGADGILRTGVMGFESIWIVKKPFSGHQLIL